MKYKIIDNFLSEKTFDYISSIKLNSINANEVLVHHNKISKDGKVLQTSCFDEKNLIEIHNYCNLKALEILNELAPKKSELYEYSDFNIIETGRDYTFPIHRDHVNKLLSGVIYLNPEKNTGTIIYDDEKGTNPNEIEWKQNRALFFSRTEKTSWHNYKGDNINNRIVLVYNLMTTNTKAVCKLEGINYHLVKLREFINPYIYRIFKKVI